MTPDQLADILRAFGYGAYVPLLFSVIGLTAKLAAILPPATPASPVAWRVARRALDIAGGNWGNAHNATPDAAGPATNAAAAAQ